VSTKDAIMECLSDQDFNDLDQLDRIQLALDLEDIFSISIMDDEMNNWKSITDVIKTVEAKL